MKSTLIAGIEATREGLNYLVPTKWWNEFCLANKQITQLQFIKVPTLNLTDFADDFLLKYQSQLLQSLQEKCLYLNFHQVKINLQISNRFDWTPISLELWRVINKKLKEKYGILSFIDRQKAIDVKKTLQLQLIFCSKTRSELFVGYMPKNANLISVIREIGFEMGFIEVTRSKVTFVQRSPQVCFSFHELEKYTVQTAPDIFLMMFNMERRQDDEEKYPLKSDYSFAAFQSKNNTINQSNEAVVGDLNTMSDNSHDPLLNEAIRNRTISTGAETPFSFELSEGFDLDRQYRVNELFGAKQPEEIEQMRQRAFKKIINHQQLIALPATSQQTHNAYLQKLAQQALQGIAKRKSYKQKELESHYE